MRTGILSCNVHMVAMIHDSVVMIVLQKRKQKIRNFKLDYRDQRTEKREQLKCCETIY